VLRVSLTPRRRTHVIHCQAQCGAADDVTGSFLLAPQLIRKAPSAESDRVSIRPVEWFIGDLVTHLDVPSPSRADPRTACAGSGMSAESAAP
jgi:hypothetical protein